MARWQHVCDGGLTFWQCTIGKCSGCSSCSSVLILVSSSRVWVVVDARVTRQFIGTTETLRAARELTCMRLLTSMRSDVSRLMFESMECLVAQGTLVRSRQILTTLILIARGSSGSRSSSTLERHATRDGSHVRRLRCVVDCC